MFENLGTTGKFIGATALFGIVTALWSKIQFIGSKLYSVVFVRIELNGALSPALRLYCANNHRKSPFAIREFDSIWYYIRPLKKLSHVVYECLGVDKLDVALGIPREESNGTLMSTRPGRIDRVFELKILENDARHKLAKRILDKWPELRDDIVDAGDGDTGAQFQERCAQIALRKFWEDKK